jgi:hypothetical protein
MATGSEGDVSSAFSIRAEQPLHDEHIPPLALELAVAAVRPTAHRGLASPHNRKRPAGEAGRFWGYYREERYVSLYMWIRGR